MHAVQNSLETAFWILFSGRYLKKKKTRLFSGTDLTREALTLKGKC